MAKKKADLIEEAKALGLEVSEKMTIAEINEAIKGYKNSLKAVKEVKNTLKKFLLKKKKKLEKLLATLHL